MSHLRIHYFSFDHTCHLTVCQSKWTKGKDFFYPVVSTRNLIGQGKVVAHWFAYKTSSDLRTFTALTVSPKDTLLCSESIGNVSI